MGMNDEYASQRIKKLQDRIAELDAIVEEAYREGVLDATRQSGDDASEPMLQAMWKVSVTKIARDAAKGRA